MSNEEESRVNWRVTATVPTVPDYRPLVDVEWGRLLMPGLATVVVHVTGHRSIGRVLFDLELIDRRYEVTRFEVVPLAGVGIDFGAVKQISPASFIRNGLAHLVVLEHHDGDQYTAERPMENPDPLWPVALTYSVAHALGQPPTVAVAEHLRISHAAAAQRVKRARDKGYLPKTEKGKAS